MLWTLMIAMAAVAHGAVSDFERTEIHAGPMAAEIQRVTVETNRAALWDEKSRKIHVLEHGGLLFAGLSADRRKAVTLGDDGATLWDARSGLKRIHFQKDRSLYYLTPFYHAAFSPDGTRIAAVGATACNVWEASTGRPVMSFLTPRYSLEYSVDFSADGKMVLLRDEESGSSSVHGEKNEK